MRTSAIYLFVILLSAGMNAQEWAPIGATWHYSDSDALGLVYYLSMTSQGDTVIDNTPCKKLLVESGFPIFYERRLEFMYSDSNRVYRYWGDRFGLLYDFNAHTGDTIKVETGFGDFLMSVDSTKLIAVNDTLLKAQYINSQGRVTFDGWVIEGIGHTAYLFPIPNVASPPVGPLRCYQDDRLGLFKLVPFACDWPSVNIEDPIEAFLSIYPNPIRDQLSIRVDKASPSISQIRLYDTQGRNIHRQTFITPKREWTLDMRAHRAGIYLLEVRLLSGERLIRKVWKR